MSETPQENGIAGVKKIKFDFEFTYSKGGDDDLGDTIVLIEPGYDDLEAHARMTSLVTKGLFGAMPLIKDAAQEGAGTGANETFDDSSDQRSAMWLMALGMSDKKYIEFVTYVKKLLTNDARYAHIEGEEIGITDMLWKEIGRQGGKQAIDRILSEFAGFFIEAMQEKKAT
jgi:hypothetical protein